MEVLTADIGLVVLPLTDFGLPDLPTLIIDEVSSGVEQRVGWGTVENGQGWSAEKWGHAAEEDWEAHCVGYAPVDKLTAKRVSLAAGTIQAETERDTLSARVAELEVAAGIRVARIGVVGRGLRSLKGRAAEGRNRAITAELRLARR